MDGIVPRLEMILWRLPIMAGREELIHNYAVEIYYAREVGAGKGAWFMRAAAGSKRLEQELSKLCRKAFKALKNFNDRHSDPIDAVTAEDRQFIAYLLNFTVGHVPTRNGLPKDKPKNLAAEYVRASAERAFQALTDQTHTRVSNHTTDKPDDPFHNFLREVFSELSIDASADAHNARAPLKLAKSND